MLESEGPCGAPKHKTARFVPPASSSMGHPTVDGARALDGTITGRDVKERIINCPPEFERSSGDGNSPSAAIQ